VARLVLLTHAPRRPGDYLEGVPDRAAMPHELKRPLTVGTVLAAAMVAVPLVLAGGAPKVRAAAWAAGLAAFLTTTLLALAAPRPRVKLTLLALAVAAVVAMVLSACDGFEGALLVLVALQLGGIVPLRVGVAWTLAQSLVLGGAVAVHWTPSAALLLVPPYFGFALLALFVADVTSRSARARHELERANAELAAAQGTIAEHSRLAERVRIARELHDAVGHRLTALGMHLEVTARLAEGEAKETALVARSLARAALEDVRAAVDRLRDDERLDVASVLRTLAAEIPAPRVHLTVPDGVCRDDPERAVTLLRCAQEILTNALRHANARNVWIDIAAREGELDVVARDDGAGTDALLAGNGLRGMRERIDAAGGRLEILTRAGEGFRLRATLPARAR
jgi:signal transduction histidine kinase